MNTSIPIDPHVAAINGRQCLVPRLTCSSCLERKTYDCFPEEARKTFYMRRYTICSDCRAMRRVSRKAAA